MVRHRFHLMFALGRFNEGVKWVHELNEACKKAGCAEGRLWSTGFGKTNECVLEYDFEDIGAMERDGKVFQSSADTMAVFRRGTEVNAPGHWPWDELLTEAPTLA